MRPPGPWGSLLWVTAAFFASNAALAAEDAPTKIHEKGRCAFRGACESPGIFTGARPALDNGLAQRPDKELKEKLVDLCGESWADTPICCDEDQLNAMATNFGRASAFIQSCPACKANFYSLWCTFTCSPDQSTFVNVTETEEKDDDKVCVDQVDSLFTSDFSAGFYSSCKDVKFGATNSRAMNIIGGGAENYSDFLAYQGQKRSFGSPFNIKFPIVDEHEFPGMEPNGASGSIPCNSSDPDYACACVDCESACTELPKLESSEPCKVGAWPCLTFAIVLVYAIFIMLLATAVTGHVWYRQHARNKHERLRLLQDSAMSDDEDDEDEIVYQAGILNRPTRRYVINTICDRLFSRLGRTCSRFPAITIVSSIVVVGLLSLGWMRFEVETDPVRLWVAPDSDAAIEKAFFDENFGPFFRAEQAFLVNDTHGGNPGPVLSHDILSWWFDVENRVRRLKSTDYGVTLQDICFKPIGGHCAVQSVTGYFDDEEQDFDSHWDTTLEKCVSNPTDCLPAFGQPLNPRLVLGGWKDNALDASALVVTWVVKNDQEGTEHVKRAIDWEKSLENMLKAVQHEAKHRGLRLSFNTEMSVEKELNKSTNTDANVVIVSYIIMFIYASLALGSTTLSLRTILRSPSTALVQSKFMLGIVGIVIVLLSVSASVGLFSAAGVKVTLIIAEVIPFLVLAIGVDNIFLIVHEFERVNISHPDELIEERMAKTLGRMGPSILLSATMETVAFALGAAVGMPAVKNFAVYAAGAVVINALLQVTMFVSVLALNQHRVEAGRADCFPCIRVQRPTATFDPSTHYTYQEEDGLQRFIRRTYAPAILGNKTRVAIVTIFMGFFTVGIALLPFVQLGLDQRVAIPNDSYLISYFNDLDNYLGVGPPVYFVTREVNATQREHQKQLCGRFPECDEFSLAAILEGERKRPKVSYIADSAASWIDDYFIWLSSCCTTEDDDHCVSGGRLSDQPKGAEFFEYLEPWLAAEPDVSCAVAGKAGYSDALVYSNTSLTIKASHFRLSHTHLGSQNDYISAYASARRISSDIESRNPGLSVFPYSKFYIFFDQYASIVRLTTSLLGCAVAACFLISALLLGSIRTGLVVALTVIMTVVDIIGTMVLAQVSLNAITVVNLIICVGIAVEFCAHIARAFQFPSARLLDRSNSVSRAAEQTSPLGFRGREARAWAALSQVGASVFSGITITKLLGVCVLAFTRSKIFELYYFRVWLALVVWAALHALVFLPVALSWCGGSGYVDPDPDGGLEEDLARRRYRALVPDDDYDSDEN